VGCVISKVTTMKRQAIDYHATKKIRLFTRIALALLLQLLCTLPTKAADYAVQKTFWRFAGTWTNSPAAITNLLSAIDVTTVTDFALGIVAKSTNTTGAGTLDFVWETSADGTTWPTGLTNNALGRTQGWFSAPITNGIANVWHTNITVDAIGYWRIRTLTNASSCNFTNLAITGYIKPKRSGP